MNPGDMLLHEWRTKLSQPAALLSLAAFALILIFSALSGRVERDSRARAIVDHESEVTAAMRQWVADVKTLETNGDQSGVPPWSGSPMDFTFASALPPAPLADFSIGQSDVLPGMGTLSLWDPDIRLFARYEFEDPVALALGAFDLGKAIVLVLPVLMIVLSFDVLSSERDAGRLGLMLAQGARVRPLFWRRLLLRCGLVIAMVLLLAACALVVNRGANTIAARLPSFALWSVCALLYGAFWFAIIGHIASKNRRGESNIMWLLVCWTAFTLIIPASVTSLAEVAYPTPSRQNYLAEAREAEIDTERAETALAHQFFTDHPELVVNERSKMPAYIRTAFFVTSAVDKATRPLLKAFDDAATRRERVLAFLRYLSPAIIAHGTFNEVAGSSSARHRQYMSEARAFKAAYARQVSTYVVAGERLPSAEAEAWPRFRLDTTPLQVSAAHAAPALLFLALATAALLVSADRRLKRFSPLV